MTGRILIVEDHRLVAVGIQLALRARGWQVEVTDGPSVDAVLELAATFQPDCVLVDLDLGHLGSGVDLIPSLRSFATAVVMLTGETDRFILASGVEAGADGWISKGCFVDDLVAAVEDVLAGHSILGCSARSALLSELRLHRSQRQQVLSPLEQLSAREQNVLEALAEGLSCEEIAASQFVAESTVRSQIRSMLRKLDVKSSLAAVAMANRAGWMQTRREPVLV
ncbi:MAG TPA: response regulator transcription factor [Microthrixaceae bacterium]|nr:response regulator transcription factor [Microthrixaceae bacterium]